MALICISLVLCYVSFLNLECDDDSMIRTYKDAASLSAGARLTVAVSHSSHKWFSQWEAVHAHAVGNGKLLTMV